MNTIFNNNYVRGVIVTASSAILALAIKYVIDHVRGGKPKTKMIQPNKLPEPTKPVVTVLEREVKQTEKPESKEELKDIETKWDDYVNSYGLAYSLTEPIFCALLIKAVENETIGDDDLLLFFGKINLQNDSIHFGNECREHNPTYLRWAFQKKRPELATKFFTIDEATQKERLASKMKRIQGEKQKKLDHFEAQWKLNTYESSRNAGILVKIITLKYDENQEGFVYSDNEVKEFIQRPEIDIDGGSYNGELVLQKAIKTRFPSCQDISDFIKFLENKNTGFNKCTIL